MLFAIVLMFDKGRDFSVLFAGKDYPCLEGLDSLNGWIVYVDLFIFMCYNFLVNSSHSTLSQT